MSGRFTRTMEAAELERHFFGLSEPTVSALAARATVFHRGGVSQMQPRTRYRGLREFCGSMNPPAPLPTSGACATTSWMEKVVAYKKFRHARQGRGARTSAHTATPPPLLQPLQHPDKSSSFFLPQRCSSCTQTHAGIANYHFGGSQRPLL